MNDNVYTVHQQEFDFADFHYIYEHIYKLYTGIYGIFFTYSNVCHVAHLR
jgi:hypothetical protein